MKKKARCLTHRARKASIFVELKLHLGPSVVMTTKFARMWIQAFRGNCEGGREGGGQAHHPVRSQSECLFRLQVSLLTWTDPCAKLSNFSDTATVLGSHFHPVHLYLASQSPSMNFILPGLMHWQKMCSKSVGESIYLVPL